MSHCRLLQILEKNGIRGNELNWFRNYLDSRKFRVKINKELSDEQEVEFGVPQGSKLGPILYLLYANDMLNCLNDSMPFAYADDTAIVVSSVSLQNAIERIQNQLNIIAKWCHDNGLVINAKKTKVMHIKPPHISDTTINIKFHEPNCLHNNMSRCESCNTYIESVRTYKYLGVYVDNNFKWNTHVDYLQRKLRKSAFMLYHLSNCATYNVLRQAYFSIVESYLRHGIAAWGSATHCRQLQTIQNRVLKILHKSQNYYLNSRSRNSNNNGNNYNYISNSNINNTNNTSYFTNSNNNYSFNRHPFNNNSINYNLHNNANPNNNTCINSNDIANDNYNTTNANNINYINNINYNNNINNNNNSNSTVIRFASINNTNINSLTASINNINNVNENNTNTNNNIANNINISNNANIISRVRNNSSNNTNFVNSNNNENISYNTNNNNINIFNDNLPKKLNVLNVNNLYKTTLAIEFYNDPKFLKEIDHHYRTRRRTDGRFKVPSFHNSYGKNTLYVALPNIFNEMPTNMLHITHKLKRKKLIKNYLLSTQ